MNDEAELANLYKKLLDKNFEPDPQRMNATLQAILSRLSESPASPEDRR